MIKLIQLLRRKAFRRCDICGKRLGVFSFTVAGVVHYDCWSYARWKRRIENFRKAADDLKQLYARVSAIEDHLHFPPR